MLSSKEARVRRRLRDDYRFYAEKCLKIRTKEGAIKPFLLNSAQSYLHDRIEDQRRETGKVRALILKGRQQGMSTYVQGRFFWRVTHRRGVRAFILTHETDATNNLFEMAHRYHIHVPDMVKPQVGASNAKELAFEALDSSYKVGTAGTKGVGRSATIQLFHGSECAFWPNADEHAKGVLQAIADAKDTEVILESTANGIGNYFHQQWQQAESGDSDYLPIFIPWYWQTEYRRPVPMDFALTDEERELKERFELDNEQLSWRRYKTIELAATAVGDGTSSFKQEYPFTSVEAFQVSGHESLISPDDVMPSRSTFAGKSGPVLIGVDPARFGKDRTALIRRQGRVAYGIETYAKKDTMEIVGITVRAIQNDKPNRVYVDVAGLGAGVVDRLRELGYGDIVVPVNGGEKAYDPDRFVNRRAEMWGSMREWLIDRPSQIPDNDALHADLCGPGASVDSKSRLKLESKDDMAKRGVRSPDLGDALALTFAEPYVGVSSKTAARYEPADDVIGF